jgi:glycine/D-amino acid oxidase-like deaminating enzyme
MIIYPLLGFKNYTLMGSRPIDYDHNYMDGSPVVGVHPILSNVFMATGFNGRGAMYAPGVGRALTELMLGKDDGPWNFFILFFLCCRQCCRYGSVGSVCFWAS